MRCKKCGAFMLRADYYDPDGMIPLYGLVEEDGIQWVCINSNCEDGKKNLR